jgi:uncharacterized membrane protein YesL
MFKKLFNPDNALMITMSQVTDCIFLSLFWALGCFPLFTVGASSAALYDAVYHDFRKGDKHSWSRFFRTFKSNLKASLLPGIVYLILFFTLVWGLIQVWNAAALGKISMVIFSAAAFLGILMLGILSVMFPLLSRFENSVSGLLRNTVLLALANMPRTLALGALNGISIFLTVKFIFPLFFLPALASLISTLLLEPMFKPYMPKEIPEGAEN